LDASKGCSECCGSWRELTEEKPNQRLACGLFEQLKNAAVHYSSHSKKINCGGK
jgi:hypothetical protein